MSTHIGARVKLVELSKDPPTNPAPPTRDVQMQPAVEWKGV